MKRDLQTHCKLYLVNRHGREEQNVTKFMFFDNFSVKIINKQKTYKNLTSTFNDLPLNHYNTTVLTTA